jgi:hypothetical protein
MMGDATEVNEGCMLSGDDSRVIGVGDEHTEEDSCCFVGDRRGSSLFAKHISNASGSSRGECAVLFLTFSSSTSPILLYVMSTLDGEFDCAVDFVVLRNASNLR